jgi:ATP-dependent helicase HrpA
LPVVEKRQVPLAPIDPQMARGLMITHALVQGEAELQEKFYRHNVAELERLQELAERTRRREWLVDPYALQRFYEERLPEEVVDLASLRKWLKAHSGSEAERRLWLQPEDLLPAQVIEPPSGHFPEQLQIGPTRLPLEYRFSPGDASDGVTVTVPQVALRQVSEEALGWLVPGLLEDKLLHMIRSLPKHLRRAFVPAPDVARKLAAELLQHPRDKAFATVACQVFSQHAGEPVRADDFEWDKLPEYLRVRVRVVDDAGRTLESSRDVAELQTRHASGTAEVELDEAPSAIAQQWNGRRVTVLDVPTIPPSLTVRRGGVKVAAFPALVDEGDAVSLRLLDNLADAQRQSQLGWLRLYALKFRRELLSQVNHLPGYEKSSVLLAGAVPRGALRDHLRDLVARIAFLENEGPLDCVAEYEARQVDAVRRISMATQEVAAWLPKLAEHYHAVRLAVESPPAPWKEVADDITTQVQEWTGEKFLLLLAWQELSELPRYLQAARMRWDKLRSGGIPKDRKLREPVDQLLQQMHQRWQIPRGTPLSELSPERRAVRVMLEELRVSAFAQQLGTRQSVSVKRIAEALEKTS